MTTPSSLLWLIKKYSYTHGQLLQAREQLEEAATAKRHLEGQIARLDLQMAQIKAVMRLHDVQIDPDALRAIRPQRHPAMMGYGEITRVIYTFLRYADEQTASTKEIVAAVQMSGTAMPPGLTAEDIAGRVRVRLCTLAKQRRLIRLPRAGSRGQCSWSLALNYVRTDENFGSQGTPQHPARTTVVSPPVSRVSRHEQGGSHQLDLFALR